MKFCWSCLLGRLGWVPLAVANRELVEETGYVADEWSALA